MSGFELEKKELDKKSLLGFDEGPTFSHVSIQLASPDMIRKRSR